MLDLSLFILFLLLLSLGLVGLIHGLRFLSSKWSADPVWGGHDRAVGHLITYPSRRIILISLAVVIPLLMMIWLIGSHFRPDDSASAQTAPLSIEILAGYNLIVDSNVRSPSTYGPSAATVAGRICNNSGSAMSNVVLKIGNYTNNTPGIYPGRNSSNAAFQVEHPALGPGHTYAFSHVGGSLGLADATRLLGSLQPGQCSVQYWTFEYPRCENSETPPCSGDAVWGSSVKPEDDLWLTFDIWGSGFDGSTTQTANSSWKMTMRNEISAMANKIEPNGNPSGYWFNTDPTTIRPGGVITTNGFLYRIGNVRFGFDNDNDYLPDYNFWVQPIGDPSQFDPGCFRLIRTSGVITVEGSTPTVIPFTDQLYFTRPAVPTDNTNVTGEVFYTFLALGSNCNAGPTPYQEAASGYDNEKFNADFGTGGYVPIQVLTAPVTIGKNGTPDSVTPGQIVTYIIPFQNQSSTESAGLLLYQGSYVNNPLVISDSIPAGTIYRAGSASATLNFANNGVRIFYSTDNAQSWSLTEPANPATVTHIQWWLNDPLPPNQTGSATFAVDVPLAYAVGPIIENCANAQFGNGTPIDEACDTTFVLGSHSIGDEVWRDDNANGLIDAGEPYLNNVTVSLYWDQGGSGTLDATDKLISTTVSGLTTSGHYLFSNLPNGDYLALVDKGDPDIPFGYSRTTADTYAVTLNGNDYLNADFGFGPALAVQKTLLSTKALEGQTIQYRIDVSNLRPGSGTNQAASCTINLWAGTSVINAGGNPDWTQIPNGGNINGPDGLYALGNFSGNGSGLLGNNFNVSALPGNIVKVEALYSLYVNPATLNDDVVRGVVYSGTTATPITNTTFSNALLNTYNGSANQGLLSWNITSARSNWSFAAFNNLLTEMYINKTGSADGQIVYLDALGFRITTDSTCGNPSDTLDPVPLGDVFNANLLDFISADPPQTSVTTGIAGPYANTGQIYWSNIGPLYAGGTREITVTFKGKETSLTASVPLTNTAVVTDAYFVTGEPANDDQAAAVTVFTPTGTITGVVWSDSGATDGWQGSLGYQNDDSFIPYVTLNLYECVGVDNTPDLSRDCATSQNNNATWQLVATTKTDINGRYVFDGLAGTYYYVAVVPASIPGGGALSADPDAAGSVNRCTDTSPDCTTTDGLWNGPNAELGTFKHVGFDAGELEVIPNINFGYNTLGLIYGSVWEDVDGDGARDPGDGALAGSVVTLANGTCTVGVNCSTVTINASGVYSFTGLAAGNYTIFVTTPGGTTWVQTVDPDDLDSNYSLTLASGQISGSHDFAYTATGPYTLGDTLYIDWDGDGTQDTAEPGISNVTVWLYEDEDGDGQIDAGVDAVVDTAVTDGTGFYQFTGLLAGNYIVVVATDDPDFPLTLGQYRQTEDYDSTLDSRAVVNLNSNINTADFGYQPFGTAAIGDLVWRDVNSDGLRAGSRETGIDNISLTLYVDLNNNGTIDPTDPVVSSTVTASGGQYLFPNLPPGRYLVDVATNDPDLPRNGFGSPYVLTTNNDPHDVTVTAGQSYLQADFGFAAPWVIGDLIYQDNNNNGQYDFGEPGLPGVTVTLYRDTDSNGIPDGPAIATNVTDGSGFYFFTGSVPDTYLVVVDNSSLAGYTQTGDPEAIYDPNTGLTKCDLGGSGIDQCDSQSSFAIALGQVDMTRDFGYLPPRAIGDRVWLDFNEDGIQDANEPGISGAVITLTVVGGSTYVTTTDIEGYYSFGGSIMGTANGTFSIAVDPSPAGTFRPTYDYDGIGTPDQANILINSLAFFTDVLDFGYVYAGNYTLTGTIFYDVGGSGDGLTDIFTPGDVGYGSIRVYLYDNTNRLPLGSTLTDPTGAYTFTNLFDGNDYTVSVDRYNPTLTPQTLTATPNGSTSYDTVTIAGANVGDIDFGFFTPAPVLNISKWVNPAGLIAAGDTLTYTIIVSNSGTVAATNGVISDTLPAEVNPVSVSLTPPGAGLTSTTPPLLATGLTIPAGQAITLTVVVTVDTTIFAGTVITNLAAVTSTEVATQTSAPVTNTVIVKEADVTIAKLDNPDPVLAGSVLTYSLIYTNNGPFAADNVYITDTLPLSVTFGGVISAPAGWSNPVTYTAGPPARLTWFTPTLAANATGQFVYTVTVSSAATNTITNSASITTTTLDNDPTNNETDEPTTVDAQIDLSLAKTVENGVPALGETITFTIIINNAGPSDATNVTVSDPLPGEIDFISASPSQGVYSDSTGIWTVGTITANTTMSMTVVATVTSSNPFTNTAEVASAAQFDPDSTPNNGNPNEDDQASVTIPQAIADLSLSKDVDSSNLYLGDTVIFTITVTNAGPDDATNVEVEDVLPVGLAYIDSLAGQGTYTTSTNLWTVGAISATTSQTLTITATVNSAGIFTNTAQIENSDQVDLDSPHSNDNPNEDDQDTAVITVTQLSTISGQVREDDDGDGDLADPDNGINAVTMVLHTDPNGDGDPGDGLPILTTTTTITGGYVFTNVIPGDYVVVETDPGGYVSTNDANGSNDNHVSVTLPPGVDSTGNDFLDTQPAMISGQVRDDTDADANFTDPDSGLGGVTVVLWSDPNGDGDPSDGLPILTTTTAITGGYVFTNVIPGDYVIVETDPTDYASTADTDPPNDNHISVTLTSGTDSTGHDFLDTPASGRIGDYIWNDLDFDGIQDAGESGLPNVTVVLISGGVPVMTTTTDAAGFYEFTSLLPGSYIVQVTPPTGYAITTQNAGADTVDSDFDPQTGQTAVINLAADATDLTWDGGLFLVQPDITLDKSVSIARIAPNQVQVVTYTLLVTNSGNIPLSTINVTDTLDVGLSYVVNSATPLPTAIAGQTLVWLDLTGGADLLPGDSLAINFEAIITTTIGSYVNSAAVEGSGPAGINYPPLSDSDTDQVTVQVEDPAVDLDKAVVPPGAVDGIITFTIQITNTGPSPLDILPLFDTFSGPIEYIGGTPPADLIDNANGTLGWNDLTGFFGDIAPGQVIVVETVFQITSGDAEISLINTAQVSNAVDAFTNTAADDQDTVTLINTPTAVNLLYFQAEPAQATIRLKWATAVEIDNYGFRLLRSTTDRLADATELTFIPGQGHGTQTGSTYNYFDSTVQPYQTYTYWLVDVDFDGLETTHAPISITPMPVHLGDATLYLPLISK